MRNGVAQASAGAAGNADLEKSLRVANLTASSALFAGFGIRSGGGSLAVTVLAFLMTGNLDRHFCAGGRLPEGNLHIIAEIRSGFRTGAAAARACAESEKIPEYIAELGENIFRAGKAPASGAEGIGRAVAVIVGPAFRIPQRVVGFRSFLELLLSLGIVRVAIGVILQGKFAIGVLDLLGAGISCHTENFVEIALTHENANLAELVIQNGGAAFFYGSIEPAIFRKNLTCRYFTQGGDDFLVL